jgi:hypothetical protein
MTAGESNLRIRRLVVRSGRDRALRARLQRIGTTLLPAALARQHAALGVSASLIVPRMIIRLEAGLAHVDDETFADAWAAQLIAALATELGPLRMEPYAESRPGTHQDVTSEAASGTPDSDAVKQAKAPEHPKRWNGHQHPSASAEGVHANDPLRSQPTSATSAPTPHDRASSPRLGEYPFADADDRGHAGATRRAETALHTGADRESSDAGMHNQADPQQLAKAAVAHAQHDPVIANTFGQLSSSAADANGSAQAGTALPTKADRDIADTGILDAEREAHVAAITHGRGELPSAEAGGGSRTVTAQRNNRDHAAPDAELRAGGSTAGIHSHAPAAWSDDVERAPTVPIRVAHPQDERGAREDATLPHLERDLREGDGRERAAMPSGSQVTASGWPTPAEIMNSLHLACFRQGRRPSASEAAAPVPPADRQRLERLRQWHEQGRVPWPRVIDFEALWAQLGDALTGEWTAPTIIGVHDSNPDHSASQMMNSECNCSGRSVAESTF